MKRIFLYGLTASLMAAFVFAGCKKDDDDDDLGGSEQNKPQKQLLSHLCEWTENGSSYQDKTEYKYDAKGHQIGENWERITNGVVSFSETREMKYDENDRYLGDEYKRVYSDGTFEFRLSENKFDNNGKLIEYTYTYSNNGYTRTEITKYKYNEHGDKTESATTTDNDRTSITKWNYEYDAQGRKTLMEYYNIRDELQEKNEYTYEGNNTVNVVGESIWDGSFTGVEVYADADYKLMTSSVYTYEMNGKTTVKEVKYTYDSNGNDIGYEYKIDGKISSQRVEEGNVYSYSSYNYDDDGNISSSYISKTVYTDSNREKPLTSESTHYDSWNGGNTYTEKNEYTYDNDGNNTGYKYYSNDKLSGESKDYVYDGNKVTYTVISYNENGEVTLNLIV